MSGERFEWYYMGEGGQLGPLSEAQMVDLAAHAVLRRDTLVWKVGMAGWVPAESVPILAERLQPTWTPPAVPVPPPAPGQAPPPQASAACPRDGTALRRESRTGVDIDWCPQCRGVWLDRGELEKLIERESRYRDGDDDDDNRYGRGRRRGGFLDNVFDVFD